MQVSDRWAERRGLLRARLAELGADVLALQECLTGAYGQDRELLTPPGKRALRSTPPTPPTLWTAARAASAPSSAAAPRSTRCAPSAAGCSGWSRRAAPCAPTHSPLYPPPAEQIVILSVWGAASPTSTPAPRCAASAPRATTPATRLRAASAAGGRPRASAWCTTVLWREALGARSQGQRQLDGSLLHRQAARARRRRAPRAAVTLVVRTCSEIKGRKRTMRRAA